MAEWNQCFYCGLQLTKKTITIDHFEPKAFGGEKMVVACGECNNLKGHETVEWFRDCLGVEQFYGEAKGWVPC